MLDSFGRSINTLRISVTDRCNYRCRYCMPACGVPDIPHDRIMRYEEIVQIARAALASGIHRFRLTGGEPLVRKNILVLVERLRALPGITDLAMTTNASLLASLARPLKTAGLDRVNISLDTMDPKRFQTITRGGHIQDVLAGIDAARDAGLTPVKINIVVPPNQSDDDAASVEAFAAGRGLLTRRIMQMDIRNGRFSVVENSDRGHCGVCNRLRLTADGYLRSCLLSDIMFDTRELGPEESIRRAVAGKPERGGCTRVLSMNRIGG